VEWINKLDKEALLDLLENLDRGSFQALQDSLLELKALAMEELLESQAWPEFTETRGGIKVLDALLEIRALVVERLQSIEQETADGTTGDHGPGSGDPDIGGYG
jgi:hypothetical protein